MMDADIALLVQTRKNVAGIVKGVSLEAFNAMAPTYKNNLYWHTGHLVVTQQLLCYKMSNTPLHIDAAMVDRFRKGTTGEGLQASEADREELLQLLETLPGKLQEDLAANRFGEYAPYQTSYGAHLGSLADAVRFNNLHEALHLGYMMSQRHHL